MIDRVLVSCVFCCAGLGSVVGVAADEQSEADPRDHWAFQTIERPTVPVAGGSAWVRNSIDAFVSRQHQQHGLTPQVEAPRVILLRRLYLDLIGIPPNAAEVNACQDDPSPDWYERAVDQLLDDPRYGERWARHWMDIWRYSDWWGLGEQLRNSQKHIWHWRDWIVESLNDGMPYDEMVRLMLAADELHPNDLGKLRATGYLVRTYFLFNRSVWMEDTVEHVGKGFLGLTLDCAKCHDHKYDPIEQTDFYRMRAFFEPYHVRTDIIPGESDLAQDGIPRAFDGELDAPTYQFVRGDERNPDKSSVIVPGVPAVFAFTELQIEPVSLPLEAWQPDRRPWVWDAHLSSARRKIDSANADLRQAQENLEKAKQKAVETTATESALSPEEVSLAEGQLALAELDLAVARAGLQSVQRRGDAWHAVWAGEDDAAGRDKTIAAVRTERQMVLAQARRTLTDAEQRLTRAEQDKREEAVKAVEQARDAMEKAERDIAAPIVDGDAISPLAGARWTPTKFGNSLVDDPAIDFPSQSSGRRSALANWITHPHNPLTARVAANHIWMRHMGDPLVATAFDFGLNGTQPTHPQLLDWLAAELVDHDWSMKHLHRIIVTSAAYRMSSSVAGGAANAAIDPDNRHWWRRQPIRIESQVVRDSLLALAGTLDSTLGGPPVLPADQATSTRRSLYFFHSNNSRNRFLRMFDEAMVKDCYRREQSVMPQQALALTNSRLVLDAAPKIAQQLSDGTTDDDTAFIRRAFAVLLGMTDIESEITASQQALDEWRKLPDSSPENVRTNFVWALINHNDFVTVR